jgi:hypothetical protein
MKCQSVTSDFQNGGEHPQIARLGNPGNPLAPLSRFLRANGVRSHRIERLNADCRSIIVQHGERRIIVTFRGASRRSSPALKKLARALGEVRQ